MSEQSGPTSDGWYRRCRDRSAQRRARRAIKRAQSQARVDEQVRREGGEGHFRGWGGSW
jgi:hypothetical protein